MPQPSMTLYGAHWCPDCRRSKQFLGEHQIPYKWVDIEQDPDGEQFVIENSRIDCANRRNDSGSNCSRPRM